MDSDDLSGLPSSPPRKRRRIAQKQQSDDNESKVMSAQEEADDFDVGFWLTRSPWLSDEDNKYSLSIDQIITLQNNEEDVIEQCLLFNFKFDLEWLFTVCPILKLSLLRCVCAPQ